MTARRAASVYSVNHPESESRAAMTTDAARPRISVINDNPDFLELMSAILSDESGYQVSLFNGEEGFPIADLRASRPDLLIVDLLLGGASGWEIVTLARADEALARVPIVICSADVHQLKEREEELASVSNVHILTKPFGVDDLTDLVATILERQPQASASA